MQGLSLGQALRDADARSVPRPSLPRLCWLSPDLFHNSFYKPTEAPWRANVGIITVLNVPALSANAYFWIPVGW